jgi:hypothetical protein
MLRYPERWLHSLLPYPGANAPRRLYGCLTALTVAVGALGLNATSPLRHSVESWVNVHLLFEFLLCTLVSARYRWCIRNSLPTGVIDINRLSRHLSRIVYLVLYGVVGLRVIVALVSGLLYGNALDFRLLIGHQVHHGTGSPVFGPRDDGLVFLATGILALVMVRALVFSLRRVIPQAK